jgi:hypothetical protein
MDRHEIHLHPSRAVARLREGKVNLLDVRQG